MLAYGTFKPAVVVSNDMIGDGHGDKDVEVDNLKNNKSYLFDNEMLKLQMEMEMDAERLTKVIENNPNIIGYKKMNNNNDMIEDTVVIDNDNLEKNVKSKSKSKSESESDFDNNKELELLNSISQD